MIERQRLVFGACVIHPVKGSGGGPKRLRRLEPCGTWTLIDVVVKASFKDHSDSGTLF